MIFPTTERWKDLERSTRIGFVLVVLIYLTVAIVGYFKRGPDEKDRQVYAWVSSNYELGLDVAKGYNLSKGGILTGVTIGDCSVYIMAPPLYHILLTGVFSLSNQDWRALRLGPIFYGLIYIYACLALAIKFFRGQQRSWLLFFALTPMILIFSAWNDLRGVTMGIIIISYLCFTNYLESGKLHWVVWSGVFYLLAFWTDYMAFSIVPAMSLQALFHPGLTRRERGAGLAIFTGFVAFGGLASLIHIAALPGGLAWFVERIAERFSNRRPEEVGGGTYSPLDFIVQQSIRFTTHYTPISIFLAGWAFLVALTRLLKRKMTAPPQNGYVPVNPLIAMLVIFTWGIPSQLGIQVAYIHRLFMYYFTGFFAFAPVLGLNFLGNKIRSPFLRQRMVTATLVIFLIISVGRSVFNLSGGSLYDIVKGISSESAELFTVEELREYTCQNWQTK